MITPSLLSRLQIANADPKLRRRHIRSVNPNSPATLDDVSYAEAMLGFPLSADHRDVLLGVANGGFGPAYGLPGIIPPGYGGPLEEGGIIECHSLIRRITERPCYGMTPICNWGDAIWSLVGTNDHAVYIVHEGLVYKSVFSFQEWLEAWLDGVNISATMFDVEVRTTPLLPVPMTRIVNVRGERV